MKVYVVTGTELGWDCVVGVYTDEEVARKEFPDEDTYIIHEEILNRTKIEDYDESREVPNTAYNIRRAKEKFEEVISSGVNIVSVSNNNHLYDVKLLIELLESEGFKITYTGKTGYAMDKQ